MPLCKQELQTGAEYAKGHAKGADRSLEEASRATLAHAWQLFSCFGQAYHIRSNATECVALLRSVPPLSLLLAASHLVMLYLCRLACRTSRPLWSS